MPPLRLFFCALAGCAGLAAPAGAALPESFEDAERPEVVTPLRGPLQSPFGYRWGRLHAGIDIGVLRTDRVRAPLAGVVVETGYLDGYAGYGNVVRMRHDGGISTLYAHLASIAVRKGDRLEQGALLGRAGCTGSCTGTHLHFEVRVRGKLVDPRRLLSGELVR